MKSTKAYVLGALIIVMSIVIIGLSVSYAYYINTIEEINPGNQGVSVTSGELTMNFATSQSINALSAGLIRDEDITKTTGGADYTAFSITFPNDSKVDNAAYSLFLTDTTMTSNFKSSYVKWALYSADTEVAAGDFSGVTLTSSTGEDCSTKGVVCDASNISLRDNVAITKGTTTSYKLYIWLSYDETELQNSLLEGTLSTKVGFRAVSK